MTVRTLTNAPQAASSHLITWTGLLNGDTGTPLEFPDYGGDATFSVDGTFGTGGSIKLEGSNDGTNYYTLKDPLGSAIVKTAGGLSLITEAPRFVRPSVTAGDGTTNLSCRLYIRRVR